MGKDIRVAVLETLQWSGPKSVTEIASIMRAPTPAVRAAVATLHDEDLVEQLNDTNAIQLTNKG